MISVAATAPVSPLFITFILVYLHIGEPPLELSLSLPVLQLCCVSPPNAPSCLCLSGFCLPNLTHVADCYLSSTSPCFSSRPSSQPSALGDTSTTLVSVWERDSGPAELRKWQHSTHLDRWHGCIFPVGPAHFSSLWIRSFIVVEPLVLVVC